MGFAPVEDLVAVIAAGEMLILVDSADRENEGDLVMAAERVTPQAIRYMASRGAGLICAPVAAEIADRLRLPLMTRGATNPRECAFTVSVDAHRGTTTGISAFDRARTVQVLADPDARPDDLRRPGHLFPLRAAPGGVLERPGHTEAAIDLARYAGLAPAGVICEIMKDDGRMARLPDLEVVAAEDGLLLGSIAEIIEYRTRHPLGVPDVEFAVPTPDPVRLSSSARLPTPMGVFRVHVFENLRNEELVVLSLGDLAACKRKDEPVLVRVHSACFTGDVLGSLRCDCGGQLRMALDRIGENGAGLFIYLPQEGRGIGLARKLEAYSLQDAGLDTVEANLRLGYAPDLREYGDAVAVLDWFGIRNVALLTNNPAKVDGLLLGGIARVERVPIEAAPGPVNHAYLSTKKGKLGHLFEAM